MAYSPRPTPADLEDYPVYLQRELEEIANEFTAQTSITLLLQSRSLPRVQEGTILFADGDSFSPIKDGGKGVYSYYNGTWHKLS